MDTVYFFGWLRITPIFVETGNQAWPRRDPLPTIASGFQKIQPAVDFTTEIVGETMDKRSYERAF